MHRVILIFDMNAFFASVELRERPELVGQKVIIGQIRRRRVVCTATTEARKRGVMKGMATLTAAKLCPGAIWLPVRKLVYEEESDEILKLVKAEMAAWGYAPAIETVGLDEAYIDLTPYCQGDTADESLEKARPIAERLKARLLAERKLQCKIGIAGNKMIAKIATDGNAPDGINILYEREYQNVLPTLDVNEIPDVGEANEKILKLNDPKFETIGDIQRAPADFNFSSVFDMALGAKLREYSFGRDDRPVKPDGPPQSFGREETFEYDTTDIKLIGPVLAVFAQELQARLGKFKYTATVIKVTYIHANADWKKQKKQSRQKKYPEAISKWPTILQRASELINTNKIADKPLYSLGITVTGLVSAELPQQTKLF